MISIRQQLSLLATILTTVLVISCDPARPTVQSTLFTEISPDQSSVKFVNALHEDADFNIIEYLYYYNGGGVAAGDINGDSLPDLFFSGNQVPNKLYLNLGDFRFQDISEKAGIAGEGGWKTGVTMADVNGDGHLDIFVCGVGSYKKFDGRNQLFINNGDQTFAEKTKEYGLAFEGFSTHAAFFDYDIDGDLDMYLLNHSVHTQRSYGNVSLRYQTDSLAGDRLYRNKLSETGKTFFENVTSTAGIFSSQIGYGLGVGISDLNRDGYPDIYVSNDFIENDYLYINSGNGTFTQQLEQTMAHTSRFSMGNDIADINNDSWPDIVTLDMLPRDESVIKTSAGEDSYDVYTFKLKYGYHKQVSRNALQLNQGPLDSGKLMFSDIAPAAGIEATDWSWGPLIADFDGDGWKDIFVSNGIVRRPNDMDYINFISNDSVQAQQDILSWIRKMPEGRVSNFIFRNTGHLYFEDMTSRWGISLPSFSNGAAVADLDNDGDPDLVINRIDETPLVYRNNTANRYIKVTVDGDAASGNRYAIGAKVIVTQGGTQQSFEIFPSRGWCSSSDYPVLISGLEPDQPAIITVIWPDGRIQHRNVNGLSARFRYGADSPLYVDTTDGFDPLLARTSAPKFTHREDNFNAFSRESLIPHMLSTEGPPLATGDVNSDKLEDVFIGGAKGQPGSIFIQTKNGFTGLATPALAGHRDHEDVGAAFFDADGDSDLDLVVVSGGQEQFTDPALLRPRLYRNDGSGGLSADDGAFPAVFLHASCVKPEDFDRDGDLDLFIGASVMPMLYGMSPMSYLFVNDGAGRFRPDQGWLGQSQFENPTRLRPGMVKDAVWTDINDDKLPDLVLVGEWMPLTILLQQNDHRFRNATGEYGLNKTRGWWNSIVAGDFDNDGDADLVAGNLGWNSRIRATPEKPLLMYLGDFDSNGGSDHILVYFNGEQSYPFASRDQLVKQLPSLKKKFLSYSSYRNVKLEDIVTPRQKGNSALMQVDDFSSMHFVNEGGSFRQVPLPFEAQLFPVFDMVADDVDGDGFEDLLLIGNLLATQPEIGPHDAGLGLMLKGNGRNEFTALSPSGSGWVVRGEGRAIGLVANRQGEKIYLVTRNNETVQAFKRIKK